MSLTQVSEQCSEVRFSLLTVALFLTHPHCLSISFHRFLDSVVCDTVTVSAIRSDHKVSTYRLIALPNKLHQLKGKREATQHSGPAAQEQCGPKEQKETRADVITGQSTSVLMHSYCNLPDTEQRLSVLLLLYHALQTI